MCFAHTPVRGPVPVSDQTVPPGRRGFDRPGQTVGPDAERKTPTVNVVRFLFKPEDSQKTAIVSSQGSIQFVLRSGVDRKSG